MLSVFFGLVSALVWGAADFAGGLASRRSSAYRVVLVAEVIGLFILATVVALMKEPFFGWVPWLWCASAGAVGSLGLVLLYRAMAEGKMSLAVPVSALMAALLPAVVGSFIEGLPGWPTFVGFGLALAAIWFISKPPASAAEPGFSLTGLWLPMLAGIGFGLYFILIHQGNQSSVIWPLVASRSGGSLLLLLFLFVSRQDWKPTRLAVPLIFLNAVLDIGGNAFYILSDQFGRMDVAAVISSLYPAATIGLAWLILKERIVSTQWIGIVAAMAALVFISI